MHKYDVQSTIGRGNYGTAYLVVEKETLNKYVIKKVPIELMTEKEKVQAKQEVKLLSQLNHPNIVAYKENFLEDNVLHIVMDYCEGGDLSDRVKQKKLSKEHFEEKVILNWFIQMIKAIRYLHNMKILHRDLKASNIFLMEDDSIKLGDFGIARVLDSTLDQAKTVVGTPYYMSPEVCESKPYSFSSDIWALGCILYELCMLKHAFEATNLLGLVFKIVKDQYVPLPPHYSPELCELVGLLLNKNPSKRLSSDAILEMPFIQSHIRDNKHLRLEVENEDYVEDEIARRKGRRMVDSKVLQSLSLTDDEISPLKSNQSVAAEPTVSVQRIENRRPCTHSQPLKRTASQKHQNWVSVCPIADSSEKIPDCGNGQESFPLLPAPSSSPPKIVNMIPVPTVYDLDCSSSTDECMHDTVLTSYDSAEMDDRAMRVGDVRRPERSSSPHRLRTKSSSPSERHVERWADPCSSPAGFPKVEHVSFLYEQQLDDSFDDSRSECGVQVQHQPGLNDEPFEDRKCAVKPYPTGILADNSIPSAQHPPARTRHARYRQRMNKCIRRTSFTEGSIPSQDRHTETGASSEIDFELSLASAYEEEFDDDDDTSTSQCDVEENYYSDDFESDGDEVFEYSVGSLRESIDLDKVVVGTEVKCDGGYVSEYATDGKQVGPPEEEKTTEMNRHVDQIRRNLEDKLGVKTFENVYHFLKKMHTEGKTNCKADLTRMVGHSKLHLCLEVDQLVYFESYMRSSEASRTGNFTN